MDNNFIMTSDSKTIEYFLEQGATLVKEQNGIGVFLNCSELNFDEQDLNYVLTNILSF